MECPILRIPVINMADPTPEEIVKIAKSGNTGQVKTLTDLRFEKYEARIAELENKLNEMFRINEEYRSANSEMFAYIQTSNAPQAASSQVSSPSAGASVHQQPGAPVSAQVIRDQAAVAAEAAAKQQEEANLQKVLETLGYRRPEQKNDTTPNDGM